MKAIFVRTEKKNMIYVLGVIPGDTIAVDIVECKVEDIIYPVGWIWNTKENYISVNKKDFIVYENITDLKNILDLHLQSMIPVNKYKIHTMGEIR